MDLFISSAYAQAAAPGGASSTMLQLLPLLLMFVVFYFLLIRPQAKRAKEHRALVAGLAAGDEVVTSGGILGKIVEAGDQFVTIEVAEGVRLKVQRHTIGSVVPKGTLKSV